MNARTSAGQPPRPVGNPAEAEALIKHLLDVMDALLGMVAEETELVRAGRLAEADQVEQAKSDMSRLYIADTARIRANQPYLARVVPEQLADLRSRHDMFRAVLQMNLAVLVSLRAISEGVIRRTSRGPASRTQSAGLRLPAARNLDVPYLSALNLGAVEPLTLGRL